MEALPCRECSAQTTAKLLFLNVFLLWGIPRVLDLDIGPQFVGEVTQELSKALSITQKFYIPGRPQSSGGIKRTKRTIKEALHKVIKSTGRDLDEKLSLILKVIRWTKAVNGYSSHMVMTSRKMKLPEAFWLNTQVPNDLDPVIVSNQLVSDLLQEIQSIYLEVVRRLGLVQQAMDRRLGWVLKPIHWNSGKYVLC